MTNVSVVQVREKEVFCDVPPTFQVCVTGFFELMGHNYLGGRDGSKDVLLSYLWVAYQADSDLKLETLGDLNGEKNHWKRTIISHNHDHISHPAAKK